MRLYIEDFGWAPGDPPEEVTNVIPPCMIVGITVRDNGGADVQLASLSVGGKPRNERLSRFDLQRMGMLGVGDLIECAPGMRWRRVQRAEGAA